MKNILTKLKTLAALGITMGLAFGAQAEKDAPAESVPIEAKPMPAPEHATILAVLTNGVAAAEIAGKPGYYPVWSNGVASVVYKAEAGYYFENGETTVTNELDTSADPAVNATGEVLSALGKPTVMLGVVAQRYPWDGMLDVNYKTPYANAGHTVTFKTDGKVLGTAQGSGGQVATASFDLNTVADGAFANQALKSVKIIAEIRQ